MAAPRTTRTHDGQGSWRGHFVLLIPVPRLESFVRARTIFYDASFLSDDPAFTHAHVTLLAPLDSPPGHEEVARVLRGHEPFDFELSRLGVFRNGGIHLKPDPAEPFSALIHALMRAFPQVRPFGGPDPEPHLTLDMVSDEVDVASTRALLGDLVPAHCRADRVELHRYEANACRVLDSWPLLG
ncbi:2'-5' RNA ligase family protein [Propionibacterium ruminifibrarum]|uniref:2'-5' RNA ligase family protein n=1 Tax=Propionibacterium ruminifibrarum TaxID=1962131 RepID=UPI001C728500|nr:2'-5' RNA ligase family protein [Propionibacterium ruminifibrarum]